MHDDLDAVVVDAEQQVRLDQLEALVHQGRGVESVHRPHRPGGMAAGLLGGDVVELVGAPAAERTAGGGQDQLGDLVGGTSAQALRQRGMFGIDGHDLTRTGRLEHQRSAGHQRLLVGQRQACSGGQRRERRFQTERPDERVEHHVDAGPCGGLLDQPGHCARPAVRHTSEALRGGRIGHRDVRHPGLSPLPGEQLGVATPCGQPDDLEPVRVGGDHVERLGADRAGAAQQQHPDPVPRGITGHRHGFIVPCRRRWSLPRSPATADAHM